MPVPCECVHRMRASVRKRPCARLPMRVQILLRTRSVLGSWCRPRAPNALKMALSRPSRACVPSRKVKLQHVCGQRAPSAVDSGHAAARLTLPFHVRDSVCVRAREFVCTCVRVHVCVCVCVCVCVREGARHIAVAYSCCDCVSEACTYQ